MGLGVAKVVAQEGSGVARSGCDIRLDPAQGRATVCRAGHGAAQGEGRRAGAGVARAQGAAMRSR